MEKLNPVCIRLKAIEEVDAGHNLAEVNKRLQNGWVYLGQKKVTRERDAGPDEFIVYSLGLPTE